MTDTEQDNKGVLLPCPFCGSEDITLLKDIKDWFCVCCVNCKAARGDGFDNNGNVDYNYSTPAIAVQQWNTRAKSSMGGEEAIRRAISDKVWYLTQHGRGKDLLASDINDIASAAIRAALIAKPQPNDVAELVNERIKLWEKEYKDNYPEGFQLSYEARLEELRWIKAALSVERDDVS